MRRMQPDHAQQLVDRIRAEQRDLSESAIQRRQWLTMGMILLGLLIIGASAVATSRIHARLSESLVRQVRRTEAMIAGMSDGVLLVDGEGDSVFINPASTSWWSEWRSGYRQARLPPARRARTDARSEELPAAQALSTTGSCRTSPS
jgi:sensor histidine kinase regulating citrate/malate metabolism